MEKPLRGFLQENLIEPNVFFYFNNAGDKLGEIKRVKGYLIASNNQRQEYRTFSMSLAEKFLNPESSSKKSNQIPLL